MTALTRAIVSHDLTAIEVAIRANPSLALAPENGWLPIEWAMKTGNVVTLMRVARLLNEEHVNHRAVLREYIETQGRHDFGGNSVSTLEQLWEQAMQGLASRGLVKEESYVSLDAEARLDVAWFLGNAGIRSLEEFRRVLDAV